MFDDLGSASESRHSINVSVTFHREGRDKFGTVNLRNNQPALIHQSPQTFTQYGSEEEEEEDLEEWERRESQGVMSCGYILCG